VYVNTTTADTILAADLGTSNTRVLLFDVVGSVYRLVGYAQAPTTAEPPYQNVSEGLRYALRELQAITGRAVLDESSRLMMPATSDGRGIDAFVVTNSAGPAARAVLVSLLPDASLASARRAVRGHYLTVADTFSLADGRAPDEQIDALLAARPSVILIAGGTDGGAREALLRLVETLQLALHVLPAEVRPQVLYAGNAGLAPRVTEALSQMTHMAVAPNLLPTLDHEHLSVARSEIYNLLNDMRLSSVRGLSALAQWASGRVSPTAQSAGLFTRFLSKLPAWPRGALWADVGSASTSLAAAFNGELYLSVQPGLGVGHSVAQLLSPTERGLAASQNGPTGNRGGRPAAGERRTDAEAWHTPAADLARWLPFELPDDDLRAFILTKSLHPNSLPADERELALEQALARHVLAIGLRTARAEWPAGLPGGETGLLPYFSVIVGSGAALAAAPRPAQAALMLLDALQPTGSVRLLLDPWHLAPALGALAAAYPLLAAHVHDSQAFVELGTVV
jgi:hypothetical protein